MITNLQTGTALYRNVREASIAMVAACKLIVCGEAPNLAVGYGLGADDVIRGKICGKCEGTTVWAFLQPSFASLFNKIAYKDET